MGGSRGRLPERIVVALLLIVTVCLVAWYGYFAPTWAPGADHADALNRGAVQILHWEDPYSVTSKFGGPLSPMLGGFLLAMPFVVLFGGMYLQTIAWFVGGVCALYLTVGARAALAASSLFAFSAWSRMALPSQSDNWITAAGVVATGSLGHWALGSRSTRATGWLVLSSILYGVALSYRFILWPTVLPLMVVLVRTYGWKRSLMWLSPAGLTTVFLVLLPFAVNARTYLDGPVAMGLQKGLRGDFPHPGVFVVLVTVAATVWGSRKVKSLSGAWGMSALSMTCLLLAVAVTKYQMGFVGMTSHYDTVAFSGAVLVFGATALVLPTARDLAGPAFPPVAQVLETTRRRTRWRSR